MKYFDFNVCQNIEMFCLITFSTSSKHDNGQFPKKTDVKKRFLFFLL